MTRTLSHQGGGGSTKKKSYSFEFKGMDKTAKMVLWYLLATAIIGGVIGLIIFFVFMNTTNKMMKMHKDFEDRNDF